MRVLEGENGINGGKGRGKSAGGIDGINELLIIWWDISNEDERGRQGKKEDSEHKIPFLLIYTL